MTDGVFPPGYFLGAGLVIGARVRFDAVAVGNDVRFVDSCDLAELRSRHPHWRSSLLAPVELIDRTGELASVSSNSVDFVVDWTLANDVGLQTHQIAAVARVLRPGGVFAVFACDSRFGQCEPAAEGMFGELDRFEDLVLPGIGTQLYQKGFWPFSRFAMAVSGLANIHAGSFELERLQRFGHYNFALLRRRRMPSVPNICIIAHGENSYAHDDGFLRAVSPTVSAALRSANVPLVTISLAERALFVQGAPLREGDVLHYLSKGDNVP